MPATNVNIVVLTGNLTQDPELKQTGGGTSVCELRIASNSSIKKEGSWESKPNFFQVNTWGAQAENCAKYLAKGSKIAIQGRLEWQSWETKEGKRNSRVVVTAQQIEFLNTPKKGNSGSSDGQDELPEGADDIPF